MKFITGNGIKKLDKAVIIEFTLCEFTDKRKIRWKFIVDENNDRYDIILGRDLLCALGICMDFEQRTLEWKGMKIKMRLLKEILKNAERHETLANEYVLEPTRALEASDRMQQILDVNSEATTQIEKWIDSIQHINHDEKDILYNIMKECEEVFSGGLGTWKCTPIEIELKDDITPYASRPFPVPKIYEEKLKAEINKFIDLGILVRNVEAEWAAPAFLIPKKDGDIRFICDFRQLNLRIKKKPYPIPPIGELLRKLERFTYVTSIDVSMGYHHIPLTKRSQNICTIITPYGKYSYKRLPMGLASAPSYFQDKIDELFGDLTYVKAYIDDILIISYGDARDHLEKLETVFRRLKEAGLRAKPEKVQIMKKEMIYLGYKISTEGISPDPTKIQAILKLKRPQTVKEVRGFIGTIQYYRDLWPRRSHILAPIADLTKGYKKGGKNKKIQWSEECEKAFKEIKHVIAKDTLLAFPDFSKPFIIHTDASDRQLGAVISQEDKPLAYYSRKLSKAQINYTVTEKELLSIVETLKEFRSILLGFEIIIYTDHINLTYNTRLSESQRVMRWRLIIEEYNPKIVYIKGESNIVADNLSRLPMQDDDDDEKTETDKMQKNLLDTLNGEIFAIEINEEDQGFPLDFKNVAQAQKEEQKTDTTFKKQIEDSPEYGTTIIDEEELITFRNRIYVPKILRKPTIQWYHWALCHPGSERLIKTIQSHSDWPGITTQIQKYTKTCPECQIYKKRTRKYGHVPPKQLDTLQPWVEVAVDLIGPYKITAQQRQLDGSTKLVELTLCAITFIDTATGWFEIKEIPTITNNDIQTKPKRKSKRRKTTRNDNNDTKNESQIENENKETIQTILDKSSARISQLFDQTWLSRYPRPAKVIFDNGVEFKKDFVQLLTDYGIKPVTTTIKNPQANSILERIHLVIHNMMRAKDLRNMIFEFIQPFSQLLAQISFAIRTAHHRILNASPAQLVYNRDMILNIAHVTNWATITAQKQRQIDKDNKRENSKRVAHDYKVGDMVFIIPDGIQRKYEWKHEGPYKIIQTHTNGTVVIQRESFTERINIRRLTPFFQNKKDK